MQAKLWQFPFFALFSPKMVKKVQKLLNIEIQNLKEKYFGHFGSYLIIINQFSSHFEQIWFLSTPLVINFCYVHCPTDGSLRLFTLVVEDFYLVLRFKNLTKFLSLLLERKVVKTILNPNKVSENEKKSYG